MGTNILPESHQKPLINQRGRRIVLSHSVYHMCFYVLSPSLSLSVLLWMLTDAVVGIGLLSHTDPSLSLCLSATLPFPLSFKRCCDTANGIIRDTDFSLSSSYHFKGYTYTKIFHIDVYINNLRHLNIYVYKPEYKSKIWYEHVVLDFILYFKSVEI